MAKKNQATIFDKVINDKVLEGILAEELHLAPEAKAYRAIRKKKREHLEKNHPDLIANGDGESGWCRCGNARFKPRAVARAEGEVKIGAGINFTCPVEAIGN